MDIFITKYAISKASKECSSYLQKADLISILKKILFTFILKFIYSPNLTFFQKKHVKASLRLSLPWLQTIEDSSQIGALLHSVLELSFNIDTFKKM